MPTENSDVQAVLNSSSGGWRPSRTVIIIAAIILAVGALWYWWASSGTSTSTEYATEVLDRGDITVLVTATGSVEPTNQVEISSELSGTILTVEFDFNDHVKAGQVLARLDTDKLEATVAHSRAALAAANARIAEAEINLEETKANYDRATQLEEKGFSSAQAFLAAKAAYQRAVAALQSANANAETAQADLTLNQTNLGKACICSPIDGVVLERNVEVGQIVAASFSAPVLFTLAEDLAKMQLQVDIDEADIGQVSEGDHALFTVEAYQDKSFPASISELRFAPLTVNGVVTYKAILAIDNADLLLRPGMTATADIIVAQSSDVLRIPNAALRFTPPAPEQDTEESGGMFSMFTPPAPKIGTPITSDTQGQRTVWVLNEDVAEPVMVTTGTTDGTFTEVVASDLKAGDKIIVDIVVN